MLFMLNKEKNNILSHLCNIRGQSSSFLFKLKKSIEFFYDFLELFSSRNTFKFPNFQMKNYMATIIRMLKS